MKHLFILLLACLPFLTYAQDDLSDLFEDEETIEEVEATFKTSRLIMAHTIETVAKNELDVRITHRFFDIAGDQGGIETLFGFDQVSDIRIGFEYGISDHLTVGVGRSKGGFTSGPKQVLDGFLKYKLLRQKTKGMPLSITLMGMTELATESQTENLTAINSFPEFKHRLAYVGQAIIARKFSKSLSLMVMPTYIHRNYVLNGDENSNFALGAGGRIKLGKRNAIIFDYYHLFSEYRDTENAKENEGGALSWYNPLGIGWEIETGGHVFHVNFSNAAGIIESQFIPYTNKGWLNGEVRFGFNISRVFALGR